MRGDPDFRTCSDNVKALLPGEWEWLNKLARTWWAETGKIRVILCITRAGCTGDDGDETNTCNRHLGGLSFTDTNLVLVRVF
jgi:hypothetical protein